MGCPSEVRLGDSLTFSIVTHDPGSGKSMDADLDPTYRVYEDVDPGYVALASGSMSLYDGSITTGYYEAILYINPVLGYEAYKSYNIYIEARVKGVLGGISYAFKVLPTGSESAQSAVLTDSIGLTDLGVTPSVSVTLSDAIGMSEPSVQAEPSAVLSDSLVLTEAFGLGKRLGLTDSISLSESYLGTPGILPKDVMVLIDAISHSLSIVLTDSIALQESMLFPVSVVLTDSLGLTDSIATAVTIPLSDILALSEAVSGIGLLFNLSSYFRQHQSLTSYFRQHRQLSSYLRGGPQ